MRAHLGQGPGLHDAAAIEDGDAISERICVDRIVGDEKAHAVEGLQVPEQIPPHRGACAGIERRERLVEQQQSRVGRQRPGESDALCLSSGEEFGRCVA